MACAIVAADGPVAYVPKRGKLSADLGICGYLLFGCVLRRRGVRCGSFWCVFLQIWRVAGSFVHVAERSGWLAGLPSQWRRCLFGLLGGSFCCQAIHKDRPAGSRKRSGAARPRIAAAERREASRSGPAGRGHLRSKGGNLLRAGAPRRLSSRMPAFSGHSDAASRDFSHSDDPSERERERASPFRCLGWARCPAVFAGRMPAWAAYWPTSQLAAGMPRSGRPAAAGQEPEAARGRNRSE